MRLAPDTGAVTGDPEVIRQDQHGHVWALQLSPDGNVWGATVNKTSGDAEKLDDVVFPLFPQGGGSRAPTPTTPDGLPARQARRGQALATERTRTSAGSPSAPRRAVRRPDAGPGPRRCAAPVAPAAARSGRESRTDSARTMARAAGVTAASTAADWSKPPMCAHPLRQRRDRRRRQQPAPRPEAHAPVSRCPQQIAHRLVGVLGRAQPAGAHRRSTAGPRPGSRGRRTACTSAVLPRCATPPRTGSPRPSTVGPARSARNASSTECQPGDVDPELSVGIVGAVARTGDRLDALGLGVHPHQRRRTPPPRCRPSATATVRKYASVRSSLPRGSV